MARWPCHGGRGELCCPREIPGRTPGTAHTTGGGTITARNGSPSGQKQQFFGRVDPFCMFAVVPMLAVAAAFLWSGIAILGVGLIVLVLLVVVIDSWANRPIRRSAPRDRDDY